MVVGLRLGRVGSTSTPYEVLKAAINLIIQNRRLCHNKAIEIDANLLTFELNFSMKINAIGLPFS